MFREYLREHSMAALLAGGRPRLFPDMDDRDAWENIPEALKNEIAAAAAQFRKAEYPLLRASQFMAFFRDGSRTAWEAPYFARRRKLILAALDACIRGDGAHLDEVVDGIWLVCEETSWVLSAHNDAGPAFAGAILPDAENPVIDLFAGQTAMILSLVCALLGGHLDAVSPLIRRRVRREVEARILLPFERRDDFWWMGVVRSDLNNWTPWIVSNVMLTAALWVEDRPRLAALLERGCLMLDRYLDCVPADGGCDEGAAYWGMAGGALLDALELLERLTDGRMAFWTDDKIRGIMLYPLRAWVTGRWFVNFADCDARPNMYGERLQFAGQRIQCEGLVALGARFPGGIAQMLDDTPQLWRLLNLLFHPVEPAADAPLERDVWIESLQLRIARRGASTLVCKAGHNGDSHNHNDVGAFMLYRDGEPVILDAGNMVYTRKTFSEARYTLWNTRSMYHNVPLIGGVEQRAGLEFAARGVERLPDGMRMDIAPAYPPEAEIDTAARAFAIGEDGAVTLTDDIALRREAPVEWVFMLRRAPRVDGQGLVSGGVRIAPDTPLEIAVEEIPVEDPRMALTFPGSLWRARFIAAPSMRHRVTFTVA